MPGAGPLAAQIAPRGEDGRRQEGLVVPLTAEIAMRLSADLAEVAPLGAAPLETLSAPKIDPERLGVGDMLDLTVWEVSDTPLFGALGGSPAATLTGLVVGDDGRIFVPFAGPQKAAGLTVDELRATVASALSGLTSDPQVGVRLAAPASRRVTVQGSVGEPGSYVIDRGALTLAPMLALAGGVRTAPEQTTVAVRRGDRSAAAVVSDVYADPALDIALRPGDQIVVAPLRERFVVLGAVGFQTEIAFTRRPMTLLAALAAAGGLRDLDADPAGVFVFRQTPRAVADALLQGPPPEGVDVDSFRPVVFQLDMTEPAALFIAQRFAMRDGDALFVANAPLTELRKILQIFSISAAPATQITRLAN